MCEAEECVMKVELGKICKRRRMSERSELGGKAGQRPLP